MEVDTFYMSLDEIAASPSRVREAAIFYGPLSNPGVHYGPCFFGDLGSSDGSCSTKSDSDGPITPDNKVSILRLEAPAKVDDLGTEEVMMHPVATVDKVPQKDIIPEDLSDILRTLAC
jgi:hypothetical protein